jgi:CHASE3 domain sensor protein
MAATLGIREKLALTFVGVFLAMIAISLVFLFSQQRLKDTEAQQNQAFQIRHSLQILRAAVLDQETGIRGFSISPQKAFLEPYERGVVAARTALSDLAKDASNAERVLLVTRIDQSLSHWQQHYAAPILTDQNGNTVNAMAGRELFDELRRQINALEALENARLKQNNRQITEQFTHNLHLALLCLFASTVFMVLGLLGVSHWVS